VGYVEKKRRVRGKGETAGMPAAAKRVEEGFQRRTKAVEVLVRQLRDLDKQFAELERGGHHVSGRDELLDYTLALVKRSFGNLAAAMAMGEGKQREAAMKELEDQYDGDYY
jgi:phage-related minor tail protein